MCLIFFVLFFKLASHNDIPGIPFPRRQRLEDTLGLLVSKCSRVCQVQRETDSVPNLRWSSWRGRPAVKSASRVLSLVFGTQVFSLKTAFHFRSRGLSTSGLHAHLGTHKTIGKLWNLEGPVPSSPTWSCRCTQLASQKLETQKKLVKSLQTRAGAD